MKRSISPAAFVLVSLASLSLACGSPAGAAAADGTSGARAPRADERDLDGIEVPTVSISASSDGPACPPDPMPASEPCSVHESYGVFVSASKGSPEGDGSRAAPLDSLTAGIHLAKRTHRRVYACAETYREAITLEDGVDMFGYFDCASTWEHRPFRAARVVSPSSPAITAVDVVSGTWFVGFDVKAPDANEPGGSSIAMRAVRAAHLAISEVHLEAGHAADGANGQPGVQLVQTGNVTGAAGARAISQTGCPMALGVAQCHALHETTRPGGVSVCTGASGFDGGAGGAGGRSGIYYRDANGVVLASRLEQVGNVASAQTARGSYLGTSAQNGADGADGARGASATSAIGEISEAGFTPANGTAGGHGKPGQGGGGGSAIQPDFATVQSVSIYGASGAGGGAGGCPGLAGAPGQGGGASIALLAFDSAMRIDRSELRSGRGGGGGRAGVASAPTRGGDPGSAPAGSWTVGGRGGDGGSAGVSGHGAGGPSIAIAHHGGMPSLTSSVLIRGAGGNGQPALPTSAGMISESPSGESSEARAF